MTLVVSELDADIGENAAAPKDGGRRAEHLAGTKGPAGFVIPERWTDAELALVMEALPVLIAYVDANERYRFMSRAYAAWSGGKPEELVGRHLREVMHEATYAESARYMAMALAGQTVTFQLRTTCPHVGTRHVRVTYLPRRRTAEHGPERGSQDSVPVPGFIVLLVDITEQKRAEERQRFLTEATMVLASSLDYEATLQAVARLAVPLLADFCAIEMVVGKEGSTSQLAVAHERPEQAEVVRELRRRHPPRPDEPRGPLNVIRTGVSEVYPEVTDEPLIGAGPAEERQAMVQALGLRSAMIVPLTVHERTLGAITLMSTAPGRRYGPADREAAEELARRAAIFVENARLYRDAQVAIEKRDDFLSVASHELKTPMTSLKLHVQSALRLIRREGVAASPLVVAERLEKVNAQLDRLTTLINHLLDATRIKAGRFSVDPQPMDLAEVVREVVKRFQDEAARAGSLLVVETPPSLPGCWDPERLDQVVTNLVANAIRYGLGRPIRVTLHGPEPLSAGPGAPMVSLCVRDQGIGIAPEDQQRIFERFERAVGQGHALVVPSRLPRARPGWGPGAGPRPAMGHVGLGLGLWIVREIAEAHEGSVTVESAPGAGSTFTVRLPQT